MVDLFVVLSVQHLAQPSHLLEKHSNIFFDDTPTMFWMLSTVSLRHLHAVLYQINFLLRHFSHSNTQCITCVKTTSHVQRRDRVTCRVLQSRDKSFPIYDHRSRPSLLELPPLMVLDTTIESIVNVL